MEGNVPDFPWWPRHAGGIHPLAHSARGVDPRTPVGAVAERVSDRGFADRDGADEADVSAGQSESSGSLRLGIWHDMLCHVTSTRSSPHEPGEKIPSQGS